MLTANRTAAAAPMPAPCLSSPSATSSTQHDRHCSAHADSWATAAIAPRRGRRNTIRPARTRAIASRTCAANAYSARRARFARVAQQQRRQQHRDQQGQRRDRRDQQRVLVAVEEVDRGEHDRAEHDQRDDVQQRLRHDRAEHDREVLARFAGASGHHQRARGLAEAGRQGRGHQHADERPLGGVGQPDAGARQGGFEDRVPREGAHDHRAAHDREAEQHERRARGDQRLGDAGQADLLEREEREHGAADRHRGEADAAGDAERLAVPLGPGQGRLEARQPLRRDPRLQVGGARADADRGALERGRRLGRGDRRPRRPPSPGSATRGQANRSAPSAAARAICARRIGSS